MLRDAGLSADEIERLIASRATTVADIARALRWAAPEQTRTSAKHKGIPVNTIALAKSATIDDDGTSGASPDENGPLPW